VSLQASFEAVPESVRAQHVADAVWLELPANVPPWTAAGLALESGDAFSLYAAGRVVLSEEAGLWNGPRFHLWARVGGRGPLLNGARDTVSFESPRAGPLELCVYSGEWGTRDGELATPVEGYALLRGGLEVLAVRWQGDARSGAEALAQAAPDVPAFVAEARRLASPVPVPEGWEYLWFLGPADIYRPSRASGGPGIRAETRDDVGILRRAVDFPLGEETTLGWRWRVESLPSAKAEDSLPTHDYLSIALEFENGQDLTWYWSAALPPGTCYRCPLPSWDRRETHWVVRSGPAGLGEWQREQRHVRADYAQAIGDPPERIVAVWLIAVSIFQKGEGAADFADIRLDSPNGHIQIL